MSQLNRMPSESTVMESKYPDIPDTIAMESLVGNVFRTL